jgi:hypothetical protein
MRTKLFIGSASAVLLAIAAVAFAGAFTTSQSSLTPDLVQAAPQSTAAQPCCTVPDCCPECLACCAEDGCCWECILCCIEMGCDPACCFPSSARVNAEASAKADACCTRPAAKMAKACCGDGCCK